MSELLVVKDLCARANENDILKGINLTVNAGEVHVIMGPNGAGKSTLANAIVGHPAYTVSGGEILFGGKNIVEDSVDERAKAGIFLSFQAPEEVDGITVENFLRTAKSMITGKSVSLMAFRKELYAIMEKLNFDKEYASRYLNVGFSGGEKKKNEILQMLVLQPKLAILDETDSGLDIDAVKTVARGINWYRNNENAVIIITHNAKILENISPDYVHVIINGKIAKTGDNALMNKIIEEGYGSLDFVQE